MDDIHQIIHQTFETEEFKDFSRASERFKIVHRCLDGIGINYTREKILSVKAYCKILDSMPKFSNDFLRTFGKEDEFKRAFLKLCGRGSPCMLNRDTGLAGVNIGIKHNPQTNQLTKSVYVKTSPKISYVLNYSEGEMRTQKYHYIFNPLLQSLANLWFQFKIPANKHALEFSKRDSTTFATVYPVFRRKPNQKPSSMHKQYNNLFTTLNECDEWQIEKDILRDCGEHFPLWTPITKGYESQGGSRKIYMGTFSYKHSAFRYFRS